MKFKDLQVDEQFTIADQEYDKDFLYQKQDGNTAIIVSEFNIEPETEVTNRSERIK